MNDLLGIVFGLGFITGASLTAAVFIILTYIWRRQP